MSGEEKHKSSKHRREKEAAQAEEETETATAEATTEQDDVTATTSEHKHKHRHRHEKSAEEETAAAAETTAAAAEPEPEPAPTKTETETEPAAEEAPAPKRKHKHRHHDDEGAEMTSTSTTASSSTKATSTMLPLGDTVTTTLKLAYQQPVCTGLLVDLVGSLGSPSSSSTTTTSAAATSTTTSTSTTASASASVLATSPDGLLSASPGVLKCSSPGLVVGPKPAEEQLAKLLAGVKVKFVRPEKRNKAAVKPMKLAQCGTAQFTLILGKTTHIPLNIVGEIMKGQKSAVFEHANALHAIPPDSANLSFTIIYNNSKVLSTADIIMPDAESYDLWTNALIYLVSQEKIGNPELSFYSRVWGAVNSGALSPKQLFSVLHKLNFDAPLSSVKTKFKEFDTDHNGHMDFNEFLNLMHALRARPEIPAILQAHSNGKTDLLPNELQHFLLTEQKESLSVEDCTELIKLWGPPGATSMNIESFEAFLTSPQNDVFNPLLSQSHQDMSKPLSQYWIASSHNTYILGDQLRGRASVEAYIKCLKKGCKCIEIDVWDGEDGNPIVTHGHTLMKPIKFENVIKVVNEYAFFVSQYPVTLSLEIHTSTEQQVKMAEILRGVLGDKIGLRPASLGEALPSPGDLLNKILIKGRVLPPDEALAKIAENKKKAEEEERKAKSGSSKGDKKAPKGDKKAKKSHALAPELSNVTFFKSGSIPDLEAAITTCSPYDMCSFSELKVAKLTTSMPDTVLRFTHQHLLRTYPKGTRVNSSNYDPIPCWNLGANFVALNYQTSSEPMWLNTAKFRENSTAGYLLKPLYMRETMGFTPQTPLKTTRFTNLVVRVLSARQLPKYSGSAKGEVIDPFVVLSICGVPQDSAEKKTKTIMNNGFSPSWEETFEFPLTAPELDILLIKVEDWDQVGRPNKVAHYAVPVHCIRPGYRCVPLFDNTDTPTPLSNLFCHFSFS
ncbi:phosphoinositide-specific phospholipase C [Pelomyxa schiedti]|nr:phosphoinositide-specific phospholipase C [Pelomyxa schiedti]